MTSAVFLDKIGQSETIPVEPGMRITDILRTHGIPANAVLTWINGNVVPEHGSIVRPGDYIEFRQVRHYDLSVVRKPSVGLYSDIEPVYAKSVLYDQAGVVEHRIEQAGPERFIRLMEETFIQSVQRHNVWRQSERVAVGLSGGRDSVAFLTLLERTRDRLPDLNLVAVTVTGLPDWEEPGTFSAALGACQRVEAEHVIVPPEEIERVFGLRRPFVEVMSQVVNSVAHPMIMVSTHQVMRRMIEAEAERQEISTVALGLNADDLVASMVTWFTSGYPMGGIPVRQIGDLRYIYPLYAITKKELTLYLELVAPELNRQGAPGRFTTGPGERSMAYAITDHLYDLWPGIDNYLFSAYARVQSYVMPNFETHCQVCHGTILKLDDRLSHDAQLCDVCQLFQRAQDELDMGSVRVPPA